MRCDHIVLAVVVAIATQGISAAPKGEKLTRAFGFRLGEGTLNDVQKKLGRAELVEKGEAGEYQASVCYDVVDRGIRLIFLSNELGGDGHDLLGFGIEPIQHDGRPCGVLSRQFNRHHDLRIGGIRLGSSRAEVERVTGPLREIGDGRVEASFEYRKRMSRRQIDLMRRDGTVPPADAMYDESIFVEPRFVDGRLVALEVWKTETN